MIALGCVQGQAAKPHGLAPVGSPGDWVTPDDYPPDALRANQTGVSAFRLDVNIAGVVTRCTITGSSGSASLDEAACRVLVVRAHFTPATDRKGHAVPSSYSSAVRWGIPNKDDQSDLPASISTCSGLDDDKIKISGIPTCGDSAASSPPAVVYRAVTVAPGGKGLICTVAIDGATRELQDDACAELGKSLQQAGAKFPVTARMPSSTDFPLKPAN